MSSPLVSYCRSTKCPLHTPGRPLHQGTILILLKCKFKKNPNNPFMITEGHVYSTIECFKV